MTYSRTVRAIAVLLALVAALGIGLLVNAYTSPLQQAETQPATSSNREFSDPDPIKLTPQEQMVKLVNDERAKAGLSPLTVDERLVASAQLKSDDMVSDKYFAHSNPTTGKHGYEYITEQNIPGCRGSENISRDKDVTSSMEWLMNSKPHREAMLSSNAKTIGIGITKANPFAIVYVQHFCMSK